VVEAKPHFDVFLSYNRLDRAVVDPLADALRERDLRVFKDDWYLRPGEFWPTALAGNLDASGAVVVAVGRNGLGPWQRREAVAALDRQDREAKPGFAVAGRAA
jgi:TIR domain